ncbi:MAG TPA: serine--tRNA ligase [Alphaproteobacteria bacterium]|nr:serine--tRNA ligase [Alphaproteobacteria bacterium]
MIDIKLLRENPELVKENIKKKFKNDKLKLVDEILEWDKEIKKVRSDAESLRARRNKLSEEINKLKKEKQDATHVLNEVKEIPQKIAKIEEVVVELQQKIESALMQIPNIMHPNVPSGHDDSENVELRTYGKIKKFDFEVKSHAEIAESLGVGDFELSAKASGKGFYYLSGDLALLNQALIRFAIDKMVSKGYTYMETPLMLNQDVIRNVTDLNDMKNQIYKIDGEELYLIGTSEHSMIGRFIDTVIPAKELPVKNTSYSMCFRKEIGSHGIDEKGLYRTHQFNKVEMVVICHPNDSMKFYQELQDITVEIFSELEIPVRVLGICSGDLGDLKHIQVDIEAWSPRRNQYFEVGSCSNLTDAQARRLRIRYEDSGTRLTPHTLNNTAIATSRAMVAILENNQNIDGTVTIPKVLHKYMHGKEVITSRHAQKSFSEQLKKE